MVHGNIFICFLFFFLLDQYKMLYNAFQRVSECQDTRPFCPTTQGNVNNEGRGKESDGDTNGDGNHVITKLQRTRSTR